MSKIYAYKYLGLLSTLLITLSLLSVAVGYKVVTSHHLIISGAALVLPFRYILGDMITEIYGYKEGRKQIFYLLICDFVFSIGATTIVFLPSPDYWLLATPYKEVLGPALKITSAACFGMVVGLLINVYLLIKFRFSFKLNSFILRAFFASGIGELIQYIIALFVLYDGLLTERHLIGLIAVDYFFQLIIMGILTIPAAILIKILVRKEGIPPVPIQDLFKH